MKYPAIFTPARTSSLIGVAVFALTGVIWQLGYFQEPELWFYDLFVVSHSHPHATDPRILIVKVSDKDIAQYDYPLRDKVLAAVLEKIESGRPVAIGLDLYRDLPQPRDGSELAVLNQTLLSHSNIITIFRFGSEKDPFLIPPPAVLAQDETRYGFNDFPYDYKTVRRAFISLPSTFQYDSLAWKLAQLYLASQKIFPKADGHSVRIGKTSIHRFRGNDGGYVGAIDGGYQFVQDFRGPVDFESMSIGDVLNQKQTEVFKDKIVLIGFAADSVTDEFVTPLSFESGLKTGQTLGVVIHAQIVNQLLRAALNGDRPTESSSTIARWLSLVFWCLCGVLAGYFVRSHVSFAACVGLGLGLIFLSAWVTFLAGYWILTFAPAVAFLLTAMLVKAYAASHEGHQRATLMRLFSQHVSSGIAQEIWNQRNLFLHGDRPAAQRLVVSILFCDLKNFSGISEKMSPDQLIAWINECQGALAQHVGKNGGIVTTYMGDGMMAAFGIPIARTTEAEMARDATNAVQCALNMVAEIRRMNVHWQAEGKPLAGLRIGIFTGEAMAGVLGSEDRVAYTVIGDTVNTASRLESFERDQSHAEKAGDCRILIGRLTYQYVKDRFPAKFVGEVSLKGKKEMTEAYKVLDEVESVRDNNSCG